MCSSRGWRLVIAASLVLLSFGCSDPGGAGGSGGFGGMGGDCTDDAINACIDLQNCCDEILFLPAFIESCQSTVRECNEERCEQVLAGYTQCAPEPEPEGGAGGGGGSGESQ